MSSTILASIDRPLDADVLDRAVDGFGLADGETLRSVLGLSPGSGTSLLVFLRHFG